MFATTPLIVAAVCVVVLLVLFLMRGTSALKGEIPKPVAIAGAVVALLVAGGVLYRFWTAPPAVAEGADGTPDMGMEGGGMGGGMGGGGRGGPSPHRDLGQLVRKMAMFGDQDGDAFTAEQKAKLLPILKSLATAEAMADEDATGKKGELEAILTEEQATAIAALELPRRRRGGPPSGGAAPGAPGAPAVGIAADGGTPPPAPGGGGGGDWRARMRTGLLAIPYVKKLYDEKSAADPAFATDDEKQSEFFRSLRGTMSPFLRGSSQEALEKLIKGLTPER